MELFILILMIITAVVAGIIPIGGTVYGVGVMALKDMLGASNTELIIIFSALLVGSIVGLILGYVVEIGSLGFIWFWSRGCFGNLTSTLGILATVIFNMVTGGLVFTSVLVLGIIAFRKDSKHLPKKCSVLLGREVCIGKDVE